MGHELLPMILWSLINVPAAVGNVWGYHAGESYRNLHLAVSVVLPLAGALVGLPVFLLVVVATLVSHLVFSGQEGRTMMKHLRANGIDAEVIRLPEVGVYLVAERGAQQVSSMPLIGIGNTITDAAFDLRSEKNRAR